MVGPEAPQVIFRHRAGGYHMVHRSLEAAGGDGERDGGERNTCSRLGSRFSLFTLPLPPCPREGQVPGERSWLSLTRCRCWQEAQGTEGGNCCSLPAWPLAVFTSRRTPAICSPEEPLAPGTRTGV